jgi:hypothetical protein
MAEVEGAFFSFFEVKLTKIRQKQQHGVQAPLQLFQWNVQFLFRYKLDQTGLQCNNELY